MKDFVKQIMYEFIKFTEKVYAESVCFIALDNSIKTQSSLQRIKNFNFSIVKTWTAAHASKASEPFLAIPRFHHLNQ